MRRYVFLCVGLVLIGGCSNTKGDNAAANSTLNFDFGDVLNSATPRQCMTQIGACPYGSGAADQQCVCHHPYYGPVPGMTVKY
jgi:hypothetical protein